MMTEHLHQRLASVLGILGLQAMIPRPKNPKEIPMAYCPLLSESWFPVEALATAALLGRVLLG